MSKRTTPPQNTTTDQMQGGDARGVGGENNDEQQPSSSNVVNGGGGGSSSLAPSIVYPTKFTWHYEGKMVHLCGSFTNWLETVPMAPEIQTPNGNQVFSVVCNLPSGYHQYKFIVDGEWRHDENQAFIQDPLGNVNNWLFVKKPSGHGGGGGGSSAVSSPSGGGIGSPGMTNAGMQSAQTGGGAYIQQQQMMQQQQNYPQGTAPLEVPGMMSPGGSSGMSDAGIIGGGQQAQVLHHQLQQDRSQRQWLNHDDSQSDSLNVEQQRRIQQQQQQQQQHYHHHHQGGSDQHLVGEISPERASQRHQHAMRDDENATEVSNVVDAGMDWVSGGINGLQIKRDGDGRRKSINVARDGGPIATAATASDRPPMQPNRNNNDYVEQQGKGNPDDYASDASRARVLEFLQRHTAYELIPESNKVVVLDTNLPVRQAFHAFYEQQLAAAPLWNPAKGEFSGMISAGEFIDLLRVLSEAFKDVKQVTEEDLDRFTVAKAREECGKSVKNSNLISVRPEDSLHLVALVLLKNNMYSVPVVSYGGSCGGQNAGGGQSKKSSGGGDTNDKKNSNNNDNDNNNKMGNTNPNAALLLHVTNLAEIFACLHRHFRGVPSSLPLFSQPLGVLPIGTWTKEFGGRRSPSDSLLRRTNSFGQADLVEAASDEEFFANLPEELQRLAPLRCVYPQTTLAEAFTMMDGVSCLPVVDDSGGGGLIDVYARSDIVKLASNNAYLNVNMNEFTIASALQNSRMASGGGYASPSSIGGNGNDAAMDGSSMNTMPSNVLNNKPPSPKFNASGMSDSLFSSGGSPSKTNNNNAYAGGFSTCTRSDTLRAAVEGLGLPGVKRLVVVDEKTGALEGIIALSDVMRFLLR